MELLKSLLLSNTPSGKENEAISILKNELKDCGEVQVDSFGNLLVHIPGPGEKLMFSTSVDEPGIFVTTVDNENNAYFQTFGAVNSNDFTDKLINFDNGIIGVVRKPSDDKTFVKPISVCKFKNINTGTMGVEHKNVVFEGDFVYSNYLQYKIGAYILAKALCKIKKPIYDLYAAFTVQSQLQNRGYLTAAENINPDLSICIGATKSEQEKPVITLMNKSAIIDRRICKILEKACDKCGVPYRLDINKDESGTGQIQRTGTGVISGEIQAALENMDLIKKTQIEQLIQVITEVCHD